MYMAPKGDETFKTTREVVSEMNRKMDVVYGALVGNPDAKQKGYFERVNDLEASHEEVKAIKNKIMGGVFVGTPILVFVWEWIKSHIFKM